MTNINNPNFNPGGIADPYDSRDYELSDVASAPVPFDWKKGFDIEKELGKKITVKDQEDTSSCGGQAWSYYAEVLEALATGSYEERSAKFVYAQTAVPTGGSTGRDNAIIFKKQGVCCESLLSSYPATEANLTRKSDITDKMRENAKLSISNSYARPGNDIESIAMAIRDHKGVIFLIAGQNNGTWLSAFPKPPVVEQWRHWVYVGKAKIINEKKHIGFINSWGDKIGEKGWQWVTEDYFSGTKIRDAWTHVLRDPNEAEPAPTAPFLKDMEYGQSSDEIFRLQAFLEELGYFNGKKDVKYGPMTKKAVYEFQKENIILSPWEYFWQRGSKVGPKTRKALNGLLINK